LAYKLVRVFPKLPVESWVVMRIHAALECLRVGGPVKEPSNDPQGAKTVACHPRFPDCFGFGNWNSGPDHPFNILHRPGSSERRPTPLRFRLR
jgi:hypothetical protein